MNGSTQACRLFVAYKCAAVQSAYLMLFRSSCDTDRCVQQTAKRTCLSSPFATLQPFALHWRSTLVQPVIACFTTATKS